MLKKKKSIQGKTSPEGRAIRYHAAGVTGHKDHLMTNWVVIILCVNIQHKLIECKYMILHVYIIWLIDIFFLPPLPTNPLHPLTTLNPPLSSLTRHASYLLRKDTPPPLPFPSPPINKIMFSLTPRTKQSMQSTKCSHAIQLQVLPNSFAEWKNL